MEKPPWVHWLVDTKERLKTTDGETVEVWEFRHQEDQEVLSAWAAHLRNHYCPDSEIDYFRHGYNYSRTEYLDKIKFPDASVAPGPSIRAGDFGEILVADYLEYLLGYWVPRTRYQDKTIRNESTKGCDIIGFRIFESQVDSSEDTLAVFEAKTQFSGKKPLPRLQDAVDGSAKDHVRRGESLNAIKQWLFDKDRLEQASQVVRFQNPEDRPYKEVFGAVALFSTSCYGAGSVSTTCVKNHPNRTHLVLLIIRGKDMMDLVHTLYRRAANEA